MSTYSMTTLGVRVVVVPQFLSEQSDPANGEYVWAYTVEVTNTGPVSVQLVARTWHITDKNGATQVVQGPGVVGEQPILREGESFNYSSACPLATPSGLMSGHYAMVTSDGTMFDAIIPPFSLDSPFDVRVLN